MRLQVSRLHSRPAQLSQSVWQWPASAQGGCCAKGGSAGRPLSASVEAETVLAAKVLRTPDQLLPRHRDTIRTGVQSTSYHAAAYR